MGNRLHDNHIRLHCEHKMTDNRLEWSPTAKPVPPEIVAAVDTVEARLTPVRIESDGAAVYAHQQPHRMPILTRADCELAGFDLDTLKAAYRMEAR